LTFLISFLLANILLYQGSDANQEGGVENMELLLSIIIVGFFIGITTHFSA
jgi:hypothetical protein